MSEYRKSSSNEILNDVFNRDVPSNKYLRIWDESNPDVTYFGYSERGLSKADSNWVIRKIDNINNTINMANGAWDDRLTLTYL